MKFSTPFLIAVGLSVSAPNFAAEKSHAKDPNYVSPRVNYNYKIPSLLCVASVFKLKVLCVRKCN